MSERWKRCRRSDGEGAVIGANHWAVRLQNVSKTGDESGGMREDTSGDEFGSKPLRRQRGCDHNCHAVNKLLKHC